MGYDAPINEDEMADKQPKVLTVGDLQHILKQITNKKAPILITDWDGNVAYEIYGATKVYNGKNSTKVEELLLFADIPTEEDNEEEEAARDCETPWDDEEEGAQMCDLTGTLTPSQRSELAAFVKAE